jgi:hypothetical protein
LRKWQRLLSSPRGTLPIIVSGRAGRERASEATLAARIHENPRDFGAVTRNSKIRREDVNLVFRLELPQDQPGTSRGLSPGAFSDFLGGPRRPLRLVPEWEASPDLQKPGWFPSLPRFLSASESLPQPIESSCCPLPVKSPAQLCKLRRISMPKNANGTALPKENHRDGSGRVRSGLPGTLSQRRA